MSNRFGSIAPELHRAGWAVIPVKPKTKRAVEDGWQHGFNTSQIARFAANGYASGNVGLLAKQFPGVDIDVADEDCAAAIEALAQAKLGTAPTRIGSWPKRLLMYGTSAPFSKIKVFLTAPDGSTTGPDGKDFAIEVLGDGQQYVVYGEHPDGFEYRWPQGGGPGESDVWDLTQITLADVQAFLAELPAALPSGWVVRGEKGGAVAVGEDDDLFANFKPAIDGWDVDRVVAEVLCHLDPDCGYDEWIKVGAALHHQGGGESEWLTAWDAWSAGSGKYVDGLCERKWDSFGRAKGLVSLASLLALTKEARVAAAAVKTREASTTFMDSIKAELAAVTDPRDLESIIAAKASKEKSVGDVDRAMLASLIQAQARVLGVKLELPRIRSWLKPKGSGAQAFKHVTEDGSPLATLENFEALMLRLGVTIRYNVISKATEILMPSLTTSMDNRENVTLAYILSECEKVKMPTRFVTQFVLAMADANLYNPVMTWIESKPWDGVSRLDAFYNTVQVDTALMSKSLMNMLLNKWLIQAVSAACSPNGISGQGVLTFMGAQNKGKTTWFKNLAPEELNLICLGLTLDVKSKDSQLIAISHWIVELGEIDATFRKSDVSALKSFTTNPVDKIRRPYAMSESQYARRTVFGASVNDEEFLADKSGNRRFWTIPVVGFQFGHGLDMQQVWAEVYERVKAGDRYNLDSVEVEALSVHNEQFEVTDPIAERLADFFDFAGAVAWDWITATTALQMTGIKDPSKHDTIAAAIALKKLNGNQRRRSAGKKLFAIPAAGSEFLK